ncbi:cobaltochelatase subunit CobN [Metallosphaera tengchongensis]|uniref:Cobaltochelatase subunit CobN n=1 Tax=Metallosphaera tengchongensis TaxID=1532350 RepID=A0A6N0NXR0_9CREN|nr:cobaltochelatase subunit CobN [Metallosphaera tengchongensis]QKR00995.1 cobaltochelatase subunit CobN [Metallosphaera tengchongensis]
MVVGKLAILIGWNGSVIRTFVREAKELGIELSIKYPRLDPIDQKFISDLEKADVVFIHHFSSEQLYQEIMDKISPILQRKEIVVVIDPALSNYNKAPARALEKISLYYSYGGNYNIRQLMLYLLSLKFNDISYRDPLPMPFSGIYHPSLDSVETDVEKYLSLVGDTGRRVGILFYRTAWADRDLELVDYVVKRLEEKGLTPIPVFVQGFGSKERGMESNEDAIQRYFMKNGKSLVDAVISLLSFSLIKNWDNQTLVKLNVPIFQGLIDYYRTEEEWKGSKGLDPIGVMMSVMMPELNGTIEPIIVGTIKKVKEGDYTYRVLVPIRSQVDYLVSRVNSWVNLRYKPNSEKKIAIILHSASAYKDLEANIGTATGLDTLQTTTEILHLLKMDGYNVSNEPLSGEHLIKKIISRRAFPETRWNSLEDISRAGGVTGYLSYEKYMEFFKSLPDDARDKVQETWGLPTPGQREYMFDGTKFVIPGLFFGNVFVGVQPKRVTWQDDENAIRLIHNSDLPVPHYWLAFYRWISSEFKADAIIHVGTHGTLEFTPGKGVGLSASCFPQISVAETPHFYIYAMNVPGEGVTAKRRSYAVLLDHLSPPTLFDEIPEEARKLEDMIEEYEEAEKAGNDQRQKLVLAKIKETSEKIGLTIDFTEPDKATHEIEHRLNLFKDSTISKGLHVFGDVPSEEDLAEYVLTATRFEEDSLVKKFGREKAKEIVINALNGQSKLPERESYVLTKVLESVHMEKESLLGSLKGNFVEPGPSGSITRGRYDVLPTGRNFYSVDLWKIPTQSAWQIGSIMAEKLIDNYYKKNRRYPRAIGFILWSTDVFRSDGELVAQIMRTVGVTPVWHPVTKKVLGVKPIPLEELHRPRIDVIVNVSGIVRDNLMNIVELLDDGINQVAKLNESESLNYVRSNSLEHHVFSAKPGAYGSGVSHAIEASTWEREADLGEIYIDWVGYAYGKGKFGLRSPESLRKAAEKLDIIIHKREIDEIDVLDDSCNYSYVGGLYLACKKIGRDPALMYEDTSNPSKPQLRLFREEIERVSIGKLLNDTWLHSQMKFGYRGATEILKKVEHLYGWAATTRLVNDSIFNNVATKIVLNNDMKRWFSETNPYALEEIIRRLIEARKRGIWNPPKEIEEKLMESYSEIEGELE